MAKKTQKKSIPRVTITPTHPPDPLLAIQKSNPPLEAEFGFPERTLPWPAVPPTVSEVSTPPELQAQAMPYYGQTYYGAWKASQLANAPPLIQEYFKNEAIKRGEFLREQRQAEAASQPRWVQEKRQEQYRR